MKLNLVTDLNESSQYRTRQSFAITDAKSVSEHLFLDMISLWILYNEYEFAPIAMSYAEKTARFGNFTQYRQSGSDMYLAIHALSTKTLFDNNSSDKVFLDRIMIDESKTIMFIRMIQRNTLKAGPARQFLQRLERNLKIDKPELRSLRRMVQNWGNLKDENKTMAYAILNRHYRRVARRSELFQIIKTFGQLEDVSSTGKTLAKTAAMAAGGIGGYMAGKAFGRSLV